MNKDIHNLFLDSLYKGLLGREPDKAGLNHWRSALAESGNFEEVYQAFLNSDEFKSLPSTFQSRSPKEFIELLLKELDDELNILDIGSIKLDYEPYVWHQLSSYLNLNVVGFDPQLESGITTVSPIDNAHKIDFFTHGFALGDGKPQNIYINNDITTSSMLKINDNLPFVHLNSLKVINHESVSTKKLDDVETPKSIDFLKIDVQGYELNILRNSIATLKKVGIVQVEVEYIAIYENQPLFADVDSFMRAHGFELVDLRNKRYPYVSSTDFSGSDTLVWADAIYRKITNQRKLLLSQALILGVVYKKWNAAEFFWRNAHKPMEIDQPNQS